LTKEALASKFLASALVLSCHHVFQPIEKELFQLHCFHFEDKIASSCDGLLQKKRIKKKKVTENIETKGLFGLDLTKPARISIFND
jgi:hypothetical protein